MRAAKVDGLYGDGGISDLILLKMLGWNPRLPVKPSDAPSKVAKSKKNFIAKRFSGPSLPKAKFKLKLNLVSPVHISRWWRGFPKCRGRMMSLGHWSEADAAAGRVTRVTRVTMSTLFGTPFDVDDTKTSMSLRTEWCLWIRRVIVNPIGITCKNFNSRFFTDVTVNLIQINNFVHTCSEFEWRCFASCPWTLKYVLSVLSKFE